MIAYAPEQDLINLVQAPVYHANHVLGIFYGCKDDVLKQTIKV